jgi:hypothetical protein
LGLLRGSLRGVTEPSAKRRLERVITMEGKERWKTSPGSQAEVTMLDIHIKPGILFKLAMKLS